MLDEYAGATAADLPLSELERMTVLPVETVPPLADLESETLLEAVREALSSSVPA